MTTRQPAVPFPGAVALTRLGVYDWEASDGVCGGSPHMHTASTEAYLVLAGKGRVETIRSSGHEVFDLAPNDLLWFSPGTIHRLVNEDNLEILAIMQNGGLPEAGDAVLTFEADILANPVRYAEAASLGAQPPSESLQEAARARRDAALAGYQQLKEAAIAGRHEVVERFQQDAVRLVQSRIPAWQSLWDEAIAPEAARTGAWLKELAAGRFGHFADAGVARSSPDGPGRIFGMCGMLQKWDGGHSA
ncbi:cupin domain-containing protein [Arthrobacter nitrophenolicus]|uniref:Mannose-6-phosphate isomerase-like protein (Cupin superfamily) n=2 Tax=Arthrobacter nitrophenolicus TaxID=683150 RepID=A0ACC6TJZ9_9MICC|nr:cupin domain-containing protein [Arthrobacter nitrophenolicus]ELT44776.1 cupin domain-containing protein [Arthrobacter nitrophenolicus]